MNICPCCGSETNGELSAQACAACGAFAVGPPLARPEKELPSYLSALGVGMSSGLLVLIFLCNTLLALFERKPFSLEFWNVVAAGETAAWRLKWLALPLSLAIIWASVRVCARIVREPARFVGLRVARAGFSMSVLLAVSLTVLIGLTIPERLRQRQNSIQAAREVEAYEAVKVLYDYRMRFNSFPASAEDLRKLPDEDGAVARLIEAMSFDANTYEPQSAIAALPPPSKTRASRGVNVPIRPVALRNAIGSDVAGEAISFTNYKLRLPGKDKQLGTEDDLMIRDSVVIPAPPLPSQSSRSAAANGNNLP